MNLKYLTIRKKLLPLGSVNIYGRRTFLDVLPVPRSLLQRLKFGKG